jgi:hypothetical protein
MSAAALLHLYCSDSGGGTTRDGVGRMFNLIADSEDTSDERREAEPRPSYGKIKGREVRGGRAAEKHRQIARDASTSMMMPNFTSIR